MKGILKSTFLLAAALGLAGIGAGRGAPATMDCRTGETCPDGTVMAGTSLSTGRPLYTTRADAGALLVWRRDGARQWDETGMRSTADGQVNIAKASLTGDFTRLSASAYCAALRSNGHADWYLPAKDELGVLYAGRSAIGGFDEESGTAYWSSSEATNLFAWSQDFSDGFQNGAAKSMGLHVRCVRQP